jgi:hypothetical protein
MKKKAGYGHEVQVKENDRQREFEKFLDTVFERLWERVIGLEMCDYCLLYGLDIVSDLAKVQVGLDSRRSRFTQTFDTLIRIWSLHRTYFI